MFFRVEYKQAKRKHAPDGTLKAFSLHDRVVHVAASDEFMARREAIHEEQNWDWKESGISSSLDHFIEIQEVTKIS